MSNKKVFLVSLTEEQLLVLDKSIIYCQENDMPDSKNLTRASMLQRTIDYVLAEEALSLTNTSEES